MRRDLTDALIRTRYAPAGGRLEIWVGRCKGLVLRVSDKGRVTFHARARGADGRKRFAALGTWPSLSLVQARTEARVTIGLMQKGGDPTAERRSARAERVREAAVPSLRELGAAWANAHARDTSPRYRAELIATVGRSCGDLARRPDPGIAPGPALMAQRIDTITIEDIACVAQAARARGVDEHGAERFTALVLAPARTKNRRGHRVPLATAAAAELQALAPPGDAWSPATGLVFPGIASRTAGLCRALRQAAGIDDWTWHDLRRTAATAMARLGCPREHVEAALNHISPRGGLTGIYQRYHFDQEAARALLRWQAAVVFVGTMGISRAKWSRTHRVALRPPRKAAGTPA
jgi:integrase